MHFSAIELAFPCLALIAFAAFVILLIIVAKATGRATRGAQDGQRGCVGNCGLVFVLSFLCILALAGLGAVVFFAVAVAAVDHNPVRSVEWHHDPSGELKPTVLGAGEHPVRLRFEIQGDIADDLADFVRSVTGHQPKLIFSKRLDENGETVTLVDYFLPLDTADLRELEADVRRDLPFFKNGLPKTVKIEFRGAQAGS